MNNNANPINIGKRTDLLYSHLLSALQGQDYKFAELNKLATKGLYVIYEAEEVIYIGTTNRTGNVRLREMTSDYRSHTLNRKLLQQYFEKRLGVCLDKFNKETK
jgi:hypothetical protein